MCSSGFVNSLYAMETRLKACRLSNIIPHVSSRALQKGSLKMNDYLHLMKSYADNLG